MYRIDLIEIQNCLSQMYRETGSGIDPLWKQYSLYFLIELGKVLAISSKRMDGISEAQVQSIDSRSQANLFRDSLNGWPILDLSGILKWLGQLYIGKHWWEYYQEREESILFQTWIQFQKEYKFQLKCGSKE